MTDDTRKGHPLLMPFPLMPFLDETAELSKGADRWVVKRKPRTYAGGSVPGSARRKQQSDAAQAEVARLREALERIEEDVSASVIGNPFQEIERLRSIARAALAKEPSDGQST